MALPALTFRERILYKDKFTAYIPVNAGENNNVLNSMAGNNIASWTIAPLSSTDPTLLQNVPCNLHLTPNFDTVSGSAGLTKVVNIDTSNLLTCQRQILLIAAMRIKATTRWGDTYWLKIQGADERETLVPCSCVFIVPDAPLDSSVIT